MTGLRDRPAAMLERVTLECAWRIDDTAAAEVRAALAAALLHRAARVGDDHDPRLLHPARTVLILLSDAACRDAAVLSAAAFVDSLDADLVPAEGTARSVLAERAAALLREVPLPADARDDLLERLVCAPAEAALVAVAERLDHARHLHLRPGLDWQTLHAQVQETYVPVAARIAPGIGRRLDRWAEAFRSRRLLL
jgi:hypothetical protein